MQIRLGDAKPYLRSTQRARLGDDGAKVRNVLCPRPACLVLPLTRTVNRAASCGSGGAAPPFARCVRYPTTLGEAGMASIIMPRKMEKPEVLEFAGGPEIFADGAVVYASTEIVRVVLFVCRKEGPCEIGRVFMPRTGFDRSLIAAAVEFLPSMNSH